MQTQAKLSAGAGQPLSSMLAGDYTGFHISAAKYCDDQHVIGAWDPSCVRRLGKAAEARL